MDILPMAYEYEQYPPILDAARELLALMPETEVIDTRKLLTERSPAGRELDVMELAERINQFQKRIDPDSYASFYPDEENHRNKIAMQLLVKNGKERYRKWLELGGFVEKPELSDEIKKILEIMQASELKCPYNMEPFVYVDSSEDIGMEEGDAIPIEDAVSLFGKLDYLQCKARKNKETLGYNKTWFSILYEYSRKVDK